MLLILAWRPTDFFLFQGSTDNITIIVVLLKPIKELICPPLVPDEVRFLMRAILVGLKLAFFESSFQREMTQAEGREAPHTHGITSTSSYVFANGDTGMESIAPH